MIQHPPSAKVLDLSRGPRRVAAIFKVFAILTCIGGVLVLAGLFSNRASNPVAGATYAAVIASTILGIATLLFFAYVLELLVDIRDNSEITTDLALIPEEVLRSENLDTEDLGVISEVDFDSQNSRLRGASTELSRGATEAQTPTEVERPTDSPVSPVSVKLCPNGHEVNEEAKFCPSCGSVIPEQTVVGRCPNGHDNREEARFCSTCGEAIVKASGQ
jgi:hypothetical protein